MINETRLIGSSPFGFSEKSIQIEFRGEFTEDLDTKLINVWMELKKSRRLAKSLSYILYYDQHVLIFRVPGATRRCIHLDDNQIIKKIDVYKDISQCYIDETEEYLNQRWIGTKIILEYKPEEK